MTVAEAIEELGFKASDFQTNGKAHVCYLSDSDEFATLFNFLDSNERFEEDLDSQDIDLFTNTVVFIDQAGEVECTLQADFNQDIYTLTLTEV